MNGVWFSWLRGACLCLALLASAAQAREFRVDLIQFDPWAKKNPDPDAAEPYVGIVVDLLKEFERRSGHRTIKTLTPYARVERDLELGDCDFSIMAWGEARAAYANRGTAFVPLEFGVRARKGVRVRSYEDLKKIIVGVPRGLKVDPRFDADPEIRKDLVLDYTLAIRKAVADRDAMAVAGSLSTLGHIIHKLKLEGRIRRCAGAQHHASDRGLFQEIQPDRRRGPGQRGVQDHGRRRHGAAHLRALDVPARLSVAPGFVSAPGRWRAGSARCRRPWAGWRGTRQRP